MDKLNTTDASKYLQEGEFTRSFLSSDFIVEKMMLDYNARMKKYGKANKLESLFLYIDSKVKYSGDRDFRTRHKFQRTAQEIWESKQTTGCTDYCLLFATFARQLGVPTTILYTAEKNWMTRLQNGEDCKSHYGHQFCECFYEGKWVLVDPTCKKIIQQYNTNMIDLDYDVGGNKKFIPFMRLIDLRKIQTIEEFNDDMDNECKTLFK